MEFKSISILSNNVAKLGEYYCELFNTDPEEVKETYWRFALGDAHISIWYSEDFYRVLSKDPQINVKLNSNDIGYVSPHLISFVVDDINAEYERIKGLGGSIIKGITEQEWGNISFWVRDPEGNIINFKQKR